MAYDRADAAIPETVARGETVSAGALSEYGAKKADADSQRHPSFRRQLWQ